MVTVKIDLGGIAGKAIIALFIAASIFTVFSIAILTSITHNFYASTYYTLSALFDASESGAQTVIANYAPLFSNTFYLLIGVSVLDGLAKAVIIGFVLAAFVNFLTAIDIKSRIHSIAAKSLKKHVIVGGYSQFAEDVSDELTSRKIPFVIIERNPDKADMLRDDGFTVINGDFTKREVLEAASIKSADAAVFATESDFENLLGIVSAKHINPNIKIITRALDESARTKMQRAGAEICLIPEIIAGLELGESVIKHM